MCDALSGRVRPGMGSMVVTGHFSIKDKSTKAEGRDPRRGRKVQKSDQEGSQKVRKDLWFYLRRSWKLIEGFKAKEIL